MSVHRKAQASFDVANWDFTQRYPGPGNNIESGLAKDKDKSYEPRAGANPDSGSTSFYADLQVSGDLTARV